MTVFDRITAAAGKRHAKVVFPEAKAPRVSEAITWLEDKGLAEVVPLAEPSDELVEPLVAARGMKEPIARRLLRKPLFRAAAMVAAGQADLMVAGADSPTRRVIEAASMAIGLSEGVSTPSSFFLMVFPDGREFIFADCAVNVSPNAEDLVAIAHASHASATQLLGQSQVALLSFSTGTSGTGEGVETVRQAAEASGFLGPIQADAALNPVIADKKGLGAGDANTLIFPSLDAGNIAYKLAQELAGAQAIGPILQGFRRPVCDLSRGASPDDIVASTLTSIALMPA